MKILVLGATGMLGAYSCLALQKCGHQIIAVGRRLSDNGFFKTQNCDFIGGVALEDAAKGADYFTLQFNSREELNVHIKDAA